MPLTVLLFFSMLSFYLATLYNEWRSYGLSLYSFFFLISLFNWWYTNCDYLWQNPNMTFTVKPAGVEQQPGGDLNRVCQAAKEALGMPEVAGIIQNRHWWDHQPEVKSQCCMSQWQYYFFFSSQASAVRQEPWVSASPCSLNCILVCNQNTCVGAGGETPKLCEAMGRWPCTVLTSVPLCMRSTCALIRKNSLRHPPSRTTFCR